ncbi:hypothetical protein Esti_006362 [Eimeria stiedai]
MGHTEPKRRANTCAWPKFAVLARPPCCVPVVPVRLRRHDQTGSVRFHHNRQCDFELLTLLVWIFFKTMRLISFYLFLQPTSAPIIACICKSPLVDWYFCPSRTALSMNICLMNKVLQEATPFSPRALIGVNCGLSLIGKLFPTSTNVTEAPEPKMLPHSTPTVSLSNQQPSRAEMKARSSAAMKPVKVQTWISRPQALPRLCIILLVLRLCVSTCTAALPQRFLQFDPQPVQQGNSHVSNSEGPHSQTENPQNAMALAILSTIAKAYDLLGTSLTVGPPTPAKDTTRHETASGGRVLGVIVCIVLFSIVLGLIVFGTLKLVKKCKTKLSCRRAFGRARAACRPPTVHSMMPLPTVVSTERRYPMFNDKLRSDSLSTICSSHCGDKPPPRPNGPMSFQPSAQLPASLPSLPPWVSGSQDLASLSIEQFCHQEYACRRQEKPTPVPPVQLNCARPQHRFLRLWRRQ